MPSRDVKATMVGVQPSATILGAERTGGGGSAEEIRVGEREKGRGERERREKGRGGE